MQAGPGSSQRGPEASDRRHQDAARGSEAGGIHFEPATSEHRPDKAGLETRRVEDTKAPGKPPELVAQRQVDYEAHADSIEGQDADDTGSPALVLGGAVGIERSSALAEDRRLAPQDGSSQRPDLEAEPREDMRPGEGARRATGSAPTEAGWKAGSERPARERDGIGADLAFERTWFGCRRKEDASRRQLP
jgi:hypothetical protein